MPPGPAAAVLSLPGGRWLLGAIGLAALQLLGPGTQASTQSGNGAVPALYATNGAHPMGTQWMPCAKHGQAGGANHNHP
jgi:hypothetical protein